MDRVKSFIKTSVLGGMTVIMPLALLIFMLRWLFDLITGLIQPITTVLVARFHMMEVVADIFVVLFILAGCFLVGVLVKTKFGYFILAQKTTSSGRGQRQSALPD